jgi:hypothetical protein
MLSLLLNAEAEPETYEQETLKKPVSSVIPEIVKIAKSDESLLLEILKCPFMVLVESSMVLKNDWMSVAFTSVSSIFSSVARIMLALLNFNFPTPGSVLAVLVSNTYSNVTPPKLPWAP